MQSPRNKPRARHDAKLHNRVNLLSKKLTSWIHTDSRMPVSYDPKSHTKKEWVFAHAVKLSEEVGELAEQLLGAFGYQRSEKQRRFTKEALGSECADVIITTLLLAKTMNIDVEQALQKKIKKIDERGKKT